MSGDEGFVLIASAIVSLIAWGRWYWRLGSVHALVAAPGRRSGLLFVPITCGVVLLVLLKLFSAEDVRNSAPYLLMYTVFGMGWLGATTALLPLSGISPRDDAVERRNPAASVAVQGALLGIMLTFAGGNLGNGPGWWVVLFSSGLATSGLLLLWFALKSLSPLADWITIDRDLASGWRLAGFLVAVGLILGRAAAGDWVSAGATLRDFCASGWFALLLLPLAAVADHLLRPTPEQPRPPAIVSGVLPALIYVSAAAAYVVLQGRW